MNKSSKGNYYKSKTKKWFEKEGYAVESIEKTQKIYDKKKDQIIFIKKDLWGGDLIACKKEANEMIWIQVKSNKVDINKGLKELEKGPLPGFVEKIVVYWELRASEPTMIKVTRQDKTRRDRTGHDRDQDWTGL